MTREEVARALRMCLEKGGMCSGCPYDRVSQREKTCVEQLGQDAGMMVRPEAKVLTLEELMKLPKGTPVWYETLVDGKAFIDPVVYDGDVRLGNFWFSLDLRAHRVEKQERFWSAEPTEEERKAVEWDE